MLLQQQRTTVFYKSYASEFQQISWPFGVSRNLAWNDISTKFPCIFVVSMYSVAYDVPPLKTCWLHWRLSRWCIFFSLIKCRYNILADHCSYCTEVLCFNFFQYPGHKWQPWWTWKTWTCWKTGLYNKFNNGILPRGQQTRN